MGNAVFCSDWNGKQCRVMQYRDGKTIWSGDVRPRRKLGESYGVCESGIRPFQWKTGDIILPKLEHSFIDWRSVALLGCLECLFYCFGNVWKATVISSDSFAHAVFDQTIPHI